MSIPTNHTPEVNKTYVFSGRSLIKSNVVFITNKHPEYSAYSTTTDVWAILVKDGTKIFRYRVAIYKNNEFRINSLNSPMPQEVLKRCEYHKLLLYEFLNPK